MRCSIADLLPSSHRLTTSRNRMRCGGSTGRRSTPSPAPPSTHHNGSSTPRPASSPRPDAATGQPSTRRRWIWPCWRWRRTAPHSMPGRPSLVRQMCTSGARLQLAIAPAGAGKTTAMRALTLAWTQDGGQVLGLAPSAAAAAVLAEQTGIRTDTLAKLIWSLAAWRPSGLGGSGRPVDTGDHRRSRHGRHPLPRHRRPVRHQSRCECPTGR